VKGRLKRAIWACAALLLVGFVACLPDPLFRRVHSTVLYSAEGRLLSAVTAEDGQWRFPPRKTVPDKFETALLMFEDQHFFDHNGVHLPSVVMAAVENISRGRVVRGGSTITMQVVRMSRNNPRRTLWQKTVEMILAMRLEWRHSKDEILGLYASHAPFGGNVVGLDAASWRYFGHPAEELSWAESAVLAVLPNAPSLIFPGRNQEKLLTRRNALLRKLWEKGAIDRETFELAVIEPLPGKPFPLPQEATHLLQTLIRNEGRGKEYRTTIRFDLQLAIADALQRHIALFEPSHVHNAAALVVEVESGQVLAYVGNVRDPQNKHGNMVDVIPARRSSGSILKPFLYAAMLDDGLIMPHSLVPDIPIQYEGFAPKNFAKSFDGAVPASRALSRSLNVPSVIMLRDYGFERFYHKLQLLGFSHLNRPAGHYGLSLILGGAEASLWDVCRAYAGMSRTIVRFGRGEGYSGHDFRQQSVLPGNSATVKRAETAYPSQVYYPPLTAGAVYTTMQSLREVNRPDSELGWEAYSSSGPVAWKTGTSYGNRDAWAVGTTPEFVVGIWVGNADGTGRPELTGVYAAAPLLFQIFHKLPGHSWFLPPIAEMSRAVVCRESGMPAGMYCPRRDTVVVPSACTRSPVCGHHQLIHLSREQSHRVTDHCYAPGDMVSVPWFVLPGVQEYYYRKKHPNYRSLPPYLEGCEPPDQSPISFIYPKSTSPVFIPRNVSGDSERTVLRAAHRDAEAVLYWHLNEEFLGETRVIHDMEILPAPGAHRITIVDDRGNHTERVLTVIRR